MGRLLRALICTAPLGFIAVEAGWVVTEVGRQPWIIYGIMRTSEAVNERVDVALRATNAAIIHKTPTTSPPSDRRDFEK